jgi:hypothetical protein
MSTIYELAEAETKLTPNPGESFEEFAERVCGAIKKLKEKEWDALPEPLQNWYNSAITPMHNRKKLADAGDADEAAAVEIPEMEGFEPVDDPSTEEIDASEAQEIAAAAANGKAEPSPKEKRIAAKLAKKAAVAPKAKATPAPKPAKVAKPAAPKPAKAAKPAAKKAETGARRGRPMKLNLDAKIKLLVSENPHKSVNSARHKRWKLYQEGMTVATALKAGLNTGNLRHSEEDGHIKLVG